MCVVFKYATGKHNVFRVNGTVFQQCIIPPTNEALTSGYDVITLATPGRKWYICGVGKHCEYGLKLFINVLPQSYPSPPPPPPPSVYPAPSGKVFVVGDDKGWTLNFDYQAWAMGKKFYVGDKLGSYSYLYAIQYLCESNVLMQIANWLQLYCHSFQVPKGNT
ncbi:putative Phytocyanin domain, cupredoxin [Helianthus annuus]|nr:putative Phytocyanin domain, cupredoxin [Helianthus annuus]